MTSKIVPVMAILLLILALACQRSDEDVNQLVDEGITTALDAIPTITPQPTAQPVPTASPVSTVSTEKIEATIDALMARLESAESELVTQEKKFQDLISTLNYQDPEDIVTGPLPGSVVTKAEESVTIGGCWIHGLGGDGTGNTFLVEWVVDGETSALCFNPISACAKEVTIGAALPRSCVL